MINISAATLTATAPSSFDSWRVAAVSRTKPAVRASRYCSQFVRCNHPKGSCSTQPPGCSGCWQLWRCRTHLKVKRHFCILPRNQWR